MCKKTVVLIYSIINVFSTPLIDVCFFDELDAVVRTKHGTLMLIRGYSVWQLDIRQARAFGIQTLQYHFPDIPVDQVDYGFTILGQLEEWNDMTDKTILVRKGNWYVYGEQRLVDKGDVSMWLCINRNEPGQDAYVGKEPKCDKVFKPDMKPTSILTTLNDTLVVMYVNIDLGNNKHYLASYAFIFQEPDRPDSTPNVRLRQDLPFSAEHIKYMVPLNDGSYFILNDNRQYCWTKDLEQCDKKEVLSTLFACPESVKAIRKHWIFTVNAWMNISVLELMVFIVGALLGSNLLLLSSLVVLYFKVNDFRKPKIISEPVIDLIGQPKKVDKNLK